MKRVAAIAAAAVCWALAAGAIAEEGSPERCAPGFAFDAPKRECVACDSPCDTGLPGICRRGLVACSGGKPSCHATIQPGDRQEVCSGEDDDCDGIIDNGYDKDGDGYTTCGGDCDDHDSGVHPDAVERCNGKDDNCNGLVDDGFNVGGTCTVGRGECRRAGHLRCSADGLRSECDVKPSAPSQEICDGKDDDCDGAIDNGLGELCCGVGACRRCVPTCQGGSQPLCAPGEPSLELCGDGIDNDCDGQVDEGFEMVGRACAVGVGACRRTGKYICSEERLIAVCDAVGSEPSLEICGNRIDDDCDGIVDADAPGLGEPCRNGFLGECRREGMKICDPKTNALVCQTPAATPRLEICNGKDDDCDGVVDNGVANACGGCGPLPGAVGAPCRIPGGDACAAGRWACAEAGQNGMICALDASLTEGEACAADGESCTRDVCHLSRCDHLPVVDGTPCVGSDACTESDICLRGRCEGGAALSCDDGNACTADSCGPTTGCLHAAIESGMKNACGGCGPLAAAPGETCAVERSEGICTRGAWACLPGGEIGCVQQRFARAEECNSEDDDCDGRVDEGLGQISCGIGACVATVENCADGKPQSCVPKEPQPESCANMGADDDCNGIADDVAGLSQDCPAVIGSCAIPGKKRCVGDAVWPVCVPVEPRFAEDDDGNGVVNYCDRSATVAGAAEAVGEEIAQASPESAGQRLFDASRTRAIMLPWGEVQDAAVLASGSPDQAMLLVSGRTGAEGGIAALRAKELQGTSAAPFRSCLVPAAAVPERLLVAGTVADVIASTPAGYVRYPRIASQIPSPLVGNSRCTLAGEPIAREARRSFEVEGKAEMCALDRVAALELLSERPLAFAGAAVCRFAAAARKKSWQGVGIDLVSEEAPGSLVHTFIPFAAGEGTVGDVRLVPLGRRDGSGFFVAATVGAKQQGGVCRRTAKGWQCRAQVMAELAAPVAFAGYVGAEGAGPLAIIAADGAAFEIVLSGGGEEFALVPAGGVSVGEDGAVTAAIPFPSQGDRPPTILFGRERGLSAAVRLAAAAAGAPGLIRALPAEAILPQSAADDVFPGGRFAFGRPHALAFLPLKGYGGRDLFAAYPIMSGGRQIGEMGFFFWNANDRPSGTLADIRFDGRQGSARLAFADPAGDALAYRATVRAHHSGVLEGWVDGFEGGRLRFSAKGDAAGVGVWPIEITVEASDPGGLSAVSRVVLRRDGTVESITDIPGI